MKAIIGIIVIFSLTACQKEKSGNNSNSQFSRKYSLNDNGCKTGEHRFTGSSAQEADQKMCEALKNEELNKFCARDLREIKFKSDCPGEVWPALAENPGYDESEIENSTESNSNTENQDNNEEDDEAMGDSSSQEVSLEHWKLYEFPKLGIAMRIQRNLGEQELLGKWNSIAEIIAYKDKKGRQREFEMFVRVKECTDYADLELNSEYKSKVYIAEDWIDFPSYGQRRFEKFKEGVIESRGYQIDVLRESDEKCIHLNFSDLLRYKNIDVLNLKEDREDLEVVRAILKSITWL